MLNRRQFIRTATGSAAGIVLGPVVLASCTSDAGVTTTASTRATGATTTSAPSTSSTAEAVVWRLSTRNQRAPCKACKAHAAHRYFASSDAAAVGRAHKGCTCAVREQSTTATQFDAWFTSTGSVVFDDRKKI